MGLKEQLDMVRVSAKERRSIQWNIDNLNSKIDSIRDAKNAIVGINEDIKSTGKSDPTADKATKVIDGYNGDLKEFKSKLIDLDYLILETKKQLKDKLANQDINKQQHEILKYYYFEGMSVEEISLALGYSERRIYQIKASALDILKVAV